MTDVVLDASVVLQWFLTADERGRKEAEQLRVEYEAGRLVVVTPSLLFLEVMNVAARRAGWSHSGLMNLAATLGDLRFEVWEPDLARIVTWVVRGLTAYDAAYVALAEERGIELISNDQAILRAAPDIARSLV